MEKITKHIDTFRVDVADGCKIGTIEVLYNELDQSNNPKSIKCTIKDFLEYENVDLEMFYTMVDSLQDIKEYLKEKIK